jgi:hypothetical protein
MEKKEIQFQENKRLDAVRSPFKQNKIHSKIQTAINPHEVLRGRGYCRSMGQPHQTNDGGYIIPLRRPPLFAALFFILLSRISLLLPLLYVSLPR